MSAARTLFDSIASEQDIQDLIDADEPETLHLDFKEILDSPNKKQKKERDELLAKAISGFANADGGVLVLGVQNKPRNLKPIAEVKCFEQEVNELLSRLVTYPVPGVETDAVPASSGVGKGYIKVLVPASDLAPHRSQKDKNYYRRTGDSFVPMEHYEIADIFSRRHHPVLVFCVRLWGSISERESRVLATAGVVNKGRAMARYPLFELVDIPKDLEVQPTHTLIRLDRWVQQQDAIKRHRYQGCSEDVIHGSEVLEFFHVIKDYEPLTRLTPTGDVERQLSARFAAEGFPVTESVLTLTKRDVDEALSGGTLTLEVDSRGNTRRTCIA